MPTIDATVGGRSANSYETAAEANTYFDNRIPFDPPWVASGMEAYLITATRLLALTPTKILVPAQNGEPAYYRIRRTWAGLPASPTQRLAWPRVGLFDANGNPLDIGITAISVAASAVITTDSPHNKSTGDRVLLVGTDSTPSLDGEQTITVIDSTNFSVPVTTTVAGTTGRVSWIPQEVKDAESEFAAFLTTGDPTLNNDVVVQGITSLRAGSVSLAFKNNIVPQVIPDVVYNGLPQQWLTDEIYEPALTAEFDVVSPASCRVGPWRDE